MAEISTLELEALRCRGHHAALNALDSLTQGVAKRLQRITKDAMADYDPTAPTPGVNDPTEPTPGVNGTVSCADVRQKLATTVEMLSRVEERCAVTLRGCVLDVAEQEKKLKVRGVCE